MSGYQQVPATCHIGSQLRKIEEYADNHDGKSSIEEPVSGAKERKRTMEREPQDTDIRPRDTSEPDPETRRSFLRRSAGLLIYVTPLIQTFASSQAIVQLSLRLRIRPSPGWLW